MPILMLAVRCLSPECERRWAATIQALRRWPACPFCGCRRYDVEASRG